MSSAEAVLAAFALLSSVIHLYVVVVEGLYKAFSATAFLLKNYGLTGLWLMVFGSKDVLRSELQVLASDGAQGALDFKKATQDESNMIAVAVRNNQNFDVTSSAHRNCRVLLLLR